jgi:hypothetical protein
MFGIRVESLVITGALLAACGAQTSSDVGPGGKVGDGGAHDAPAGLGGRRPGTSADAFGPLAPPTLSNPGDAACAAQSVQAMRKPLDLVMLIDSSDSMTDATSTPNVRKWDAVTSALKSFFADGRSAGLGVALSFFPQLRSGVPASCTADNQCNGFGPCNRIRVCTGVDQVTPCNADRDCGTGQRCVLLGQCSASDSFCIPVGSPCGAGAFGTPLGNTCNEIAGYCNGRDLCEASAYATPAVTFAPLPQANATLTQALSMRMPDGLTPTAPALAAAYDQAKARTAAQPDRRVAVVVATDGFPTECNPVTIDGIAQLARGAVDGKPSILTFVVGVFAPDEQQEARMNLDAIAKAGGTTAAHLVTTNQNVSAGFLTALNNIRQTALSCEYTIPQPTNGQRLDYFQVNVLHTPSSGGADVLMYVKDRASCGGVANGWYYDRDPLTGGTPTSIVMCPQTCTNLGADVGGRVDILLGCATNANG